MKYDFFNNSKVSTIGKIVNNSFRNKIISEIMKYKTSGKLLEIGPGRGDFLRDLKNYGFNCCWQDDSPSEYVKKNFSGESLRFPTFSPFKNSRFDVILSCNIMEHLLNFQEACLFVEKCGFMLGDSGILALCVPDYQDYGTKFFTVPDHSYPTTRHSVDILLNTFGFKKASYFHIYGGIKGISGRLFWWPVRTLICFLWYILPDEIRYSNRFEKADQIYRGEYVSIWIKQ